MFHLEQFKTVVNQTKYFRHEHRSALKLLMAENRKADKTYRRMCDVLGEAFFNFEENAN